MSGSWGAWALEIAGNSQPGGFSQLSNVELVIIHEDGGEAQPEYGRGKGGVVRRGGPLRLPWQLT